MRREEHYKQISLASVGSAHSVWTTLGLPQFTVCVLSQSTLLRLQVALQGNRLKQAPVCVHFPGLSRSGSGSRVLHKGTDSVGPAFCALPSDQMLGEHSLVLSPPRSQPLGFLGGSGRARFRCAVCLFWAADLWL